MNDISLKEQRRRLAHAYKTLRRTIYWAKHAARCEWHYDNCRYPLRNYYKHGTLEDMKAAWTLRVLIRVAVNHTSHDL